MAATDQFYFPGGGCKNSKQLFNQIFFQFQHHIPSNMGMCKSFLKDVTEILNGRQGSTPVLFYNAKTLKSEIIQILLSHSPRYGDVQVTFSRFY